MFVVVFVVFIFVSKVIFGIVLVICVVGQDIVLLVLLLVLLVLLYCVVELGWQVWLQVCCECQVFFDQGGLLDFCEDIIVICSGDWCVVLLLVVLQDCCVEIIGLIDLKMVINVLNFGVKVFMVDFEDLILLIWCNLLVGQQLLVVVVCGDLEYIVFNGKYYMLCLYDEQVVLIVCLCGWYLDEKYVCVDGQFFVGGLFDVVVFVFYNVCILQVKDCGLYFYLFKLQSMEEVVLWEIVLLYIEGMFGLLYGQIKVIVLIEMLLVVFEMDEILYVLCDCIVGLNCGCWDYIFLYLKIFCCYVDCVLFECGQVIMIQLFLKVYLELLIQICYCCGVYVMGGMVVQILINNDVVVNEQVMVCVCVDKLCEVSVGYDGIWVVYLVLILVVMVIFDEYMFGLNQYGVLCQDVCVGCDELIVWLLGIIICVGFEGNVEVCVCYLVVWLDGNGCVLIYYLMEDVVIVEISCSQLWQWLYMFGQQLDDGIVIDQVLLDFILVQLLVWLGDIIVLFGGVCISEVIGLFGELSCSDELIDFLILLVYVCID